MLNALDKQLTADDIFIRLDVARRVIRRMDARGRMGRARFRRAMTRADRVDAEIMSACRARSDRYGALEQHVIALEMMLRRD